jgi:hypothetical protein
VSDELRNSIRGAFVQGLVGLLAFIAMWFLTVRDDINSIQSDVIQLQSQREELKARSNEQAKALQSMALEVRELRVTITLLGRGLNLPGFKER